MVHMTRLRAVLSQQASVVSDATPFTIRLTVVLGMSLLLVAPVAARDWHVLPEPAGEGHGRSWEHALGGAALSRLRDFDLQPGDRVLIGSGEYRDASMQITAAGNREAPLRIEGVDRGGGLPRLISDWRIEQPESGGTAVDIAAGVSHVVLRGLRLEGFQFAVMARAVREGGSRSQLRLENLDMRQVRHGLYLSDCDDLEIINCSVRRYSKHGFRLNAGCDRVVFRGCIADCSEGDARWEDQTELFPFGFIINDAGAPNTAIHFEDCLAANNLMPMQTNRYKNGDGFVVEENSQGVEFLRCRALRNQDGGYDLKPPVRLDGCIAIGNSRNFRLWTTGELTNCFSGWAPTGLWCNGGPVRLRQCTLFALRDEAVETDDDATSTVTLAGCLVAAARRVQVNHARGRVELSPDTVVDASPDGRECQFVQPRPDWDGLGDAMNSRRYPDRGYRHDR